MGMLKPVEAVFLDIGWTLMYPPSGSWMLSVRAKELLKGISQEQIQAVQNRCYQKLENNHLVQTVDDEYRQFHEFYTELYGSFPELGITARQISDITDEKVYDDEVYTFFDDSAETVKYLEARYKLGIISDTWPSIERVLRRFGYWDAFSHITFSCALGVFKPHENMYRHALRGLGIPAESTVFVDDYVKNLRGARKEGMQGVLITVSPENEPTDEFVCIDRISGLRDYL